MSRPKSARNRGLPDNLTFDTVFGKYRYRNPRTGHRQYIGTDRKKAARLARAANARIYGGGEELLIERIAGSGQHRWHEAVDRYITDIIPELDLATKTKTQYLAYLARMRRCDLENFGVDDISVSDVVATLGTITTGKRMRNVYRSRMIEVFRYTVELGWRKDNPAQVTRAPKTRRQRERMTIEDFQKIREYAEPWLKVAMDLALVTLQRREDVSSMRYNHIEAGWLYVRQHKTGKKLRIHADKELTEIVRRSHDTLACPYIVHRRPKRTPPKSASERDHRFQVLGEQIQRGFAEARESAGIRGPNPPTFHEIRSLGGNRYRSLGWHESEIQALYGHEDRSMTDAYLAGHEVPWEDVGTKTR